MIRAAIVQSALGRAAIYLYHQNGEQLVMKYSKIPRASLLVVNPDAGLQYSGPSVDALFTSTNHTKNLGICTDIGEGVTDDEPSVNNPKRNQDGFNVFSMPVSFLKPGNEIAFEKLMEDSFVMGEEMTWSEVYGLEEWFGTIQLVASKLDGSDTEPTINLLGYFKYYAK
jgi:hypothetical protein